MEPNVILAKPTPQPRQMWVVWLLFFCQFAAIGAYFTFLNIYFRAAGLSGAQIGLLNMTAALIGMVGAVGWGILSDRTGKVRLLIAAGAVGSSLLAQIVPLVHTFEMFVLLTCLSSLANSSLIPLVDSTALSMLGERREEYGRYRLGGTLGYILTASTAGLLYDQVGLQWMFPIYGVFMLLFAGVALLLPKVQVMVQRRANGEIAQMIRQPDWILFMGSVFLVWIASIGAITFMGVSLRAMGASQGLIGLTIMIGAVVEIPFMAYNSWFLRRFGPKRLFLVGIALIGMRLFLLGWMPAPAWAIPINALNGVAYVFFWNSAVTYANQMAPAGQVATAQGVFNSTVSLAGVISGLLTGLLFDRLGPQGIFVVLGFFSLAAFILFGVGSWRAAVGSRPYIPDRR